MSSGFFIYGVLFDKNSISLHQYESKNLIPVPKVA